MNLEQKLVIIFSLLGLLFGILSSYLTFNVLLAFFLPLLSYFIIFSVLANRIKEKRKRWIFGQTFITFLLIWLLVWITIFNL